MPWVLNASDEINAQSKHPTIIAVCVILTLLMTAVALLRVYVHLQAGQLRADDNVIVATMVNTPLVSFICDYCSTKTKATYSLGSTDLRHRLRCTGHSA